ncbi:hypothetical protein PoB_004405900 [Plakobranchus ocellatus]|uniref:BESS domain-containing protein n=1 Tax=Plakobranchus ocellatus TaxID=259542 RepID=A0AAV4BBN7_9GAST|nr:hypothetical protein PoB_004405900 [Plakobranchus ocellatus]
MQFLLPGCSTGASSSNLPDDEESNASHSDIDVEQSSQASHARLTSLQTVDTQSISSAVSNTQQRRKRKAAIPQKSEIVLEILRAFKTPQQQQPQEVDVNEHVFQSRLPAIKILDTLQTMHFCMDVQRLLLSYMEKAPSRTAMNLTSPVHLPHVSSSGLSSVPLMGQFSP